MNERNSESILETIKQLLGGNICGDAFDEEVIININSVMSILTQLGVGPKSGYYITGDGETWGDYIGDRQDIEMIKTYIYMKVRLIFDPPSNSFLTDSIKNFCSEFEWRLNVEIETPADSV